MIVIVLLIILIVIIIGRGEGGGHSPAPTAYTFPPMNCMCATCDLRSTPIPPSFPLKKCWGVRIPRNSRPLHEPTGTGVCVCVLALAREPLPLAPAGVQLGWTRSGEEVGGGRGEAEERRTRSLLAATASGGAEE